MKENKIRRNSLIKKLLSAAMIIGVSTLLLQGVTLVVAAGVLNRTDTITTSYINYVEKSSHEVKNNLPEGYKKANYTVETINLEAYRNQKPTINDLTREDAAEKGAQFLWSVFQLSLEGQAIEMGYNEAVESLPRSNWFGYIQINDKLNYSFTIDSVTGELFSVGCIRTLDENIPLGFDSNLAKNSQEYIDHVKDLAEKHNVVHGTVKTVEYDCQGYQNNDPDICFKIIGENGEIAQINVSRYDKALLSINYYARYKYTLEYFQNLEKKTWKMDGKLVNPNDKRVDTKDKN